MYLFQVKPVLKLDDTVLAEGTAIGMGQPQYYTMVLLSPHNSYAANATAMAGDEIVFGVNGSGITPQLVQKRLEQVPSNTAAENLHQAGLHFWMEHDLFDNLAAQVYGVHTQRMPSVGTFFVPLTVKYFFGIPKSGYYKQRQIDVKRNVQTVAAPSNEILFQFLSHIGMHGSYLESSVLDQLFGQTSMPARSTAQVLREASQQNIPIYTITPDNINDILPHLSVSAEVKTDIVHAVHAGKQAIIPQRELVVGNWTGTGYILQDRVTGAAAYLIDGGYNGGTHEGCVITLEPTPSLYMAIKTAVLFSKFDKEQVKLKASMKRAQKYNEIENIQADEQKFDTTVRLFVASLTALGLEPWISGKGCLVAKAKYTGDKDYIKGEFYGMLKADEKTKEMKADVMFTAFAITTCSLYKWQIVQHSIPIIPITTQPKPEYTYSFTQTGEYLVNVMAECQGNPNTQKTSIPVYILTFEEFNAVYKNEVSGVLGQQVDRVLSDFINTVEFQQITGKIRKKHGSVKIADWEEGPRSVPDPFYFDDPKVEGDQAVYMTEAFNMRYKIKGSPIYHRFSLQRVLFHELLHSLQGSSGIRQTVVGDRYEIRAINETNPFMEKYYGETHRRDPFAHKKNE